MSEPSSIPQYLTEIIEQPPAASGESQIDCAEEILRAYTMLMKTGARERDAFDQAARIYRGRNPGVANEAARRAAASIICRKP